MRHSLRAASWWPIVLVTILAGSAAGADGGVPSNDARSCNLPSCATARNKAPIARNDHAATDSDTAVRIDVTANDRDRDGRIARKTVRIVRGPLQGTAVRRRSGAVIYTPAPGFSGRDVFSYRVKDNDGKSSNRARVAVSVRSGGGPPGANNLGPAAAAGPDQNTQSGQPVALNGSASSDPDGDPITFSWRFLSVPPISTRVDADIVNRATPAPSFTSDVDGAYSLELAVSDGALFDTDSVLITAASGNVAPNADAGPDQNADRAQAVSLDGRGSADPDNGPDPLGFTWSFAEVPADSSLVDADIANATVAQASFVPDVVGPYRLTLTTSDGDLSDQDEVAITVTLPNVPPNANAGADRVVQLGPPPQTAFLDGRLSNDPDDGPVTPLAFQWGFVSQPPGIGLVDGDITGANSKTPGFIPNVAGSYVLRLVVSDGPDTHEDHVLVKANAAPLTMPDRFSMLEDTTLRRGRPGVLDNDTDANRDHLTAVLVRPPAHAAIIPFRLLCFVFPFAHADDALPARAAIDFVPFPIGFPDFSLCGDGSFTYTPERNFTGTDSFTYRANDGSANSNVEETVTITVQATNDPPVAQDDPLPSISEDTPLEAASVLGNDSDEDRTPLTAVLVRGPSHAAFFNLNLNGTFSYTPPANFNGLDSFTYRANDGIATSNVATVTITVNAVNDRPAFTKGPNQTVNNNAGPRTVNPWATGISAGPANESGQTRVFHVTNNNPELFSADPAVSTDGVLTFTPRATTFGTATITLTLSDNGGTANGGVNTSSPASFTITTTPPPFAPVQAIFNARCTGCHSNGNQSNVGGLTLQEGSSLDDLVNVTSSACPNPDDPTQPKRVRVARTATANDAANSCLFLKVSGASGVGARMPLGCTVAAGTCLSQDQINDIANWINGGAGP